MVNNLHTLNTLTKETEGRSQWPRGLRRRYAAARQLRLWVRIPREAWMSVCCECCVLSGRGLCDQLITRREESYRLWCVVVCEPETWRGPGPLGGRGGGCSAKNKQTKILLIPSLYWPQYSRCFVHCNTKISQDRKRNRHQSRCCQRNRRKNDFRYFSTYR